VECQGEQCRLRDLNSRFGTTLNGVRVTEAIVRDGDRIVAGQKTVVGRVGGGVGAPGPAPPAVAPGPNPGPPPPPPHAARPPAPPEAERPPATPQDRVLPILREQPEPLFALLDAARDPKVLELLRGSGEDYQSLYEGPKGEELADWAPYVVRLSAQSGLLETLV